ncbi:MAG: hypothetical protein ACKOA9_08820 [Actinomycetota bacterium]
MTAAPAPRWQIRIHADPPGIHSWSILCGLSLLDHSGEARVRVSDLGVPAEPGIWLEVCDLGSGTTRTICVDVADSAGLSSPQRAARADAVWKRSWTPGTGRPLGLVAGMRSGHEQLGRYAAVAAWTGVRHLRPRALRALRSGLARARAYRDLGEYEVASEKRPVVLFQVAAWAPEQTGDPETGTAVNDDRARLIAALRAHLGPRFVGGFTRSAFTERAYPHLVSDQPQSRAEYVALIRSSGITVSSVGLHGSNPWKLAEYLATGAAVVSEPLRYGLPESLDGVARFFASVDEAVAVCDGLLTDADARRAAQARATDYWQHYARPDALLRRRLTEEFAS